MDRQKALREFFGPSPISFLNAAVNRHDALPAYVQGYRRGADLLVEAARSESMSLDHLVFPIMYLYRHHMELALKQTCRDASRLLEVAWDRPRRHGLSPLWKAAEPLLMDIWPGGDRSYLDPIDRCVSALDLVDKAGAAFRYEDTDCLADVSSIDLEAVSEAVREASNILDGILCGIGEYLDWQAQAEAEAAYW